MSTRQADRLSNDLTDDLTWRVREISAYVRSIPIGDKTKSQALLRAGVPLLYAHWEGYFNFAANSYLAYVSDLRKPLTELTDNYYAIVHMRKYQPQAIKSDKDIYNLIYDMRSSTEATFRKGRHIKVSGKSNLNSDVLRNGCKFIGLSVDVFIDYFSFIDKNLIPDRNFIAHGESNAVSFEKFEEYRTKVTDMMRVLKDEIENAAYMERYLKQ